jgi:UDPglucose 6-dehydrogenase
MKIGFIGQGFIGKHMADDFAERGFLIVRYALEPEYAGNRDAIATCDIVFIAVPTPTTPAGFDASALESALALVGAGAIAVIKSTMLPGTTKRLQTQFPLITLFHAPEFLREKTAAEDTRHPERTIIGMPILDEEHKMAAERVLGVLPKAPFEQICSAETAELIKYGGNCFLALKVVYMNMLYDAAKSVGANYDEVATAMAADARIGNSHMRVVDTSGHSGSVPGRGAGGHCFPKDLAAFASWYKDVVVTDPAGSAVWQAVEAKNNQLLTDSQKDLELLVSIYGSLR